MGATHHPSAPREPELDLETLAAEIRQWGTELGFDRVGITDTDLADDAGYLDDWLAAGHHGTMDYLARGRDLRARPEALHPHVVRVISVRMNYLPYAAPSGAVLGDPVSAFVSRYALGRDYHKVLRTRLRRLARRIETRAGPHGHRVFTDSAPVLEKALARKAGLGWIGKHTNLIAADAGSWFFLGEIFTSLPLPVDRPATNHCGTCRACIDVCPTRAIVGPYRLDARRCISYLTIELRGTIPPDLRPGIGNRIFGCDDCQLVCPWNRFARLSAEPDFAPRQGLDAATLIELFAWDEPEFLARTEGSAIRRTGHEGWLRNIAVALGNALRITRDRAQIAAIERALRARLDHPGPVVREHIQWALEQRYLVS